MNATVLSSNFHQAVYDAIHPTDDNGKRQNRCKGSALPVLNHVLITDHEGRIAVYTHDLDKPVVVYAPARIEETIAICVPAYPLLDWLDIIKKDTCRVDLTVDARACLLIVQAQNARATFKCLDAAEFPSVANAQEPGAKDTTLASVGMAVSKDDARPELQKVCHRAGVMVGTDGLRLHMAPSDKTEIPEGYPIEKLDTILASEALPGYTVIVPAAPLLAAVKSMKAVSKAGDQLVTFHCNGAIELSAESEETGLSRTQVEILNSTGPDIEFTLPVQYVLDALTHICPKQKRARGVKAELQTVTIHALPFETFTIPAPVWFTSGDLKAAIMPCVDLTVPEGTVKPTKSELMSAYNRKRAAMKREGQGWKVYELNRAFGDLQRGTWTQSAHDNAMAYTLLGEIVQRRRAAASILEFLRFAHGTPVEVPAPYSITPKFLLLKG